MVGTQVLDLIKIMRPHGQGTGPGRFGIEIMARVLDNEAQVLIAGKIDC